MRRDKILNVICNHKISEHLKLEPFQNSNNTLTWFARDFSEETGGLDELFALKFKVRPLGILSDHYLTLLFVSEREADETVWSRVIGLHREGLMWLNFNVICIHQFC